jgi:hypothetical protein
MNGSPINATGDTFCCTALRHFIYQLNILSQSRVATKNDEILTLSAKKRKSTMKTWKRAALTFHLPATEKQG